MTGDNFPKSVSGRVIEWAKITGALSVIASAGFGVYSTTVGPLRQYIDRIDRLITDVEQIKSALASITGEDRVIRQPDGMSFIREPVHKGEDVVMLLVASRTTLGKDCRRVSWAPIFQDSRLIETPGVIEDHGVFLHEIGHDLKPMQVTMTPPANLVPGRIRVHLAVLYKCPTRNGEQEVPDKTRFLTYELLE